MGRACITAESGQSQWAKCRKTVCFAAVLCCCFLILICLIKMAAANDRALWPEEGQEIWYNGDLVIDISNASQGYFLARAGYEILQRLKLRVVFGATTLDYDLPGDAQYIVVPLQMGSGYYEVSLYENVSGKKYMQTGTLGFYAQLVREDMAFLYPNQYVDYTPESEAVTEADKLSLGQEEKAVFDLTGTFIKQNFVYDFIKAVTIQPGMLPDIDGSFEKRMGVCQDLSAIMCCMLRTQGIPCRLVIGYADSSYHAWIVATVDGEEIFYDPTAELSAISMPREYSVERFY